MPPRKPSAAPQEPQHPLYRRLGRILELPVPATAKAILVSLARHGDWETGTSCRPAVATLAREASVTERHAQRLLRYLVCRVDMRCIGGRDCPHWGLIDLESLASPGRPASYALNLDPTMFQLAMPELGGAHGGRLRSLERPVCREPGCRREHHARGLCKTHYMRAWRHGDAAHAGRQPIFGSERIKGAGLGGYLDSTPAQRGQGGAAPRKEASA